METETTAKTPTRAQAISNAVELLTRAADSRQGLTAAEMVALKELAEVWLDVAGTFAE